MIINNDSLTALKEIEDNSIDVVITDPPYGYSFMGKSWDKAVPSIEIWQECLRVLKPGGWCMVMSAPRSDVQNAMISRLMEAGFRLDFTPIYWTYASGFPKAGNVGKLVDKRLGVEREVLGSYDTRSVIDGANRTSTGDVSKTIYEAGITDTRTPITEATSPQAKALDGSYTGFQPKPAVEVIIVAMKPLSEKTYVDQALKNGKGITWLDDCRIPTKPRTTHKGRNFTGKGETELLNSLTGKELPVSDKRFPANLLVSDDVLNDGRISKSHGGGTGSGKKADWGLKSTVVSEYPDSGSYSRYFDLDKWAAAHLPEQQMKTFPFAIFPKASKSEKNKGLEHFEEKIRNDGRGEHLESGNMPHNRSNNAKKNHHPTVKPLKLMSYLITLTTREGDTVLDPFVGSGTTVVAANSLNRKGIGIEREEEYAEIARARVEANRPEPQLALEGEASTKGGEK